MNTTVREAALEERSETASATEWAVLIVHHADARFLGLRRVIPTRSALELGRESGVLGDGAFEHPRVSRVHARIEVDAHGGATVSDLGSANGTWVDGVRVGTQPLTDGSVLRVGPVLLLTQRAPASYALRRSGQAPVLACATARFEQALREAIARRGVLAITGAPPLAWSPYLRRALADAGVRLVDAPAKLHALEPGCATILADGAHRDVDRALDEALRARKSLAVLALDERTREAAHETRPFVLAMPPLRERVEDIPWLVRAALEARLGAVPAIDPATCLAWLRSSWPEDVPALETYCDHAAARVRAGESPLRLRDADLRHLGEPRERPSVRPPSSIDAGPPSAIEPASSAEPGAESAPALRIARTGAWFTVGAGAPVDLRVRFALARVLAALVSAREAAQHDGVSIERLVEAGWPGERTVNDSGTNRVYVAIATLRRLGLRECIERREGAYRLAPHWPLDVSASEQPPTPSTR